MNKNFLEGSVTKSLILFTIPLVLGNILQQFYNIADSFIVSHFISSFALGAVGSAFSLMVFLTSIILGLCLGSGVLFSMQFGANREHDMRNSVFMSFIGIGILTIVLEILCLIFLKDILVFLNIPNGLFTDTYQYVRVILLGLFFTFLYNFFSTLLRSLGNSKTPLYFLAICSLINIVLDYIFIVYFHLGISGAAFATVIAQAISGIGLMVYVCKYYSYVIPKREDCYYNKHIFIKIKDYSLMTCLQQSVMNFGILMIQGLVNSFGVEAMAAFSICVKIDAFAYMPVQDFGNAFSTFIAMNTGAKKTDRIKEGIKQSFLLSGLFSLLISILVYIFAKDLLIVFIDSSNINMINIGIQYLHIEGMFYIFIGWLFLLYGYYRGIGKAWMSFVLTVISLGTRVCVSYSFARRYGIDIIWWSIVLGWVLADLTGMIYYIKNKDRA